MSRTLSERGYQCMATVETNGVDTYYEESGNGPPVVFIHGATLDHRMWRPTVTALNDEYRTVVYDYRGHGQTGATDREEYSISLLVDDLRTLVEELDLERPILCGHSYGGLIAAEYAIQYPDDVAGIVFADARTDIGENLFERVMFRIQPQLLQIKDVVGRERFQQAMEFINKHVVNAEQGPDEEVPELGMKRSEYSEACTEATPDEELVKNIQAGLEYAGTHPTAFHVPVLYVYGEFTGDVIADKAEGLKRAPTDVRVEEIKNSGHGFPLEQPEVFVQVLQEFLDGVAAEPLDS
jgi:pimeloyl-ACP methyl ester carboxylesterase